ncbi:Phage tail sheath protein [Rhizobiales bacterium GAS191]|nr:Phage tail sheath protein [Rhizobiales bacterium GAS113]SEE84765.1 Phage tail sheath protein [Rhizobiales bacterium GAS191]
MSVMILPGTYIDVLPEGLIAPGQVTIGNLGILGTASKGAVGKPTLLSSYNDALSIFGSYDSFMDPNDPTKRRANALTLVRALQLAFASGASIVYAVRVADANAAAAKAILQSASGACVELDANSPGLWGNSISVTVAQPGGSDILTRAQTVTLTQAQATAKQITLDHASVASNRNRVSIRKLDGTTVSPSVVTAAPGANQVEFTGATLVFGDTLDANSVVTAVYMVDPILVAKVTVALGTAKEPYLVTDGNMLVAAINDPQSGSSLVTAAAGANAGERPTAPQNLAFNGGANGEVNPDYSDPITGFDSLLDFDAHIIVAAGQNATAVGAALDAHCQKASTDVYKRDRIAVVGSDFAKGNTLPLTTTDIVTYVDKLIGNTLASDRVVFVAPGFLASSAAAVDQPVNPVTLPGAYTAAVIAGMLAALEPHLSLTNKPVAVQGLEVKFNNAQLTELVQNRVTALEIDRGIRVLRGQTTDVGPFREITTRRIVDFAKYGVRSAAGPYIGLLNNDRVRGALRATINSFLKGMLDDEMLVGYGLEVTATRDQQIKGMVQVTMTLQPVFSINFIHVTMILS